MENMSEHTTPQAPIEITDALRNDLRNLAASIATETGEFIRAKRETGVSVAATKSSAADVVTEADHAAEERIVAAIRTARPQDGIVAEEGHAAESETGITWVIDPIDGTVNYLYHLPAYGVSIAATVPDASAYADGRRAIAAAVFFPATGELFSAAEGLGATRNGEAIRVSTETDLAQSLLATGFGYTPERRTMQIGVLTGIIPHVRDIRRMGSAAYDLCQLAAGKLDVYYEIGIQPWDWAAAALVITEAGGVSLGIDDQHPAGSDLFLAGPPRLATDLQQLLKPQLNV